MFALDGQSVINMHVLVCTSSTANSVYSISLIYAFNHRTAPMYQYISKGNNLRILSRLSQFLFGHFP